WGDGQHSGKHATAIFPDAMRYLWKDWPAPVKKGATQNQMMNDILDTTSDWQIASEGNGRVDNPAVNPRGEVFFSAGNKTFTSGLDGKVAESNIGPVQAFDVDGQPHPKPSPAPRGTVWNDMTVAHNGDAYATQDPTPAKQSPSEVWLIHPGGIQQ